MTEDEFNTLVDCRFPYRDADAARRLIDLGRSISTNAHFITLEEICRRPANVEVTAAEQLALLGYWAEGFAHPLNDVLMVCARALIEDRHLTVDRVLQIMDEIAPHVGAYGALNVAYFACDDTEDRVEARRIEITEVWRGKSARH
jgi:hypothetical protein